jgi:hypothetical protein
LILQFEYLLSEQRHTSCHLGTYNTEDEAAIAYNKAAHILQEKGIKKSFPENYPESLSAIAYASIYNSVKISARIRNYVVD